MVFQSQKMQLKSVRVVLKNAVNELYVCRNVNESGGGFYSVMDM